MWPSCSPVLPYGQLLAYSSMVPRKGGPNGFSVSYEFENWDSEIARVRAQCSVVCVCVCW